MMELLSGIFEGVEETKEDYYTEEEWERMNKEEGNPITLLDKHKKAW